MDNPYQSFANPDPNALTELIGPRRSHAVWLCVMPWKFDAVAKHCTATEGFLLGWCGLSVQIGLSFLCQIATLDEPYGSVEEIIAIPLRGFVIAIAIFGALPSALLMGITTGIFGVSRGRLIALTPWVTLIPFFAWLFCYFNWILAQWGFTIVVDRRPEWMKQDLIVTAGSPVCWATVFLTTMALVTAYSYRRTEPKF